MIRGPVTTAALLERARRSIPGGVNSIMRVFDPALVMTRASGAAVWDEDGRRYVDFHAAFGPTILGHAHPEVDARAAEAARDMDLVGIGPCESEIDLAEKLIEHIPSAEAVHFCNSGSEATYHAVRLSRAASGRRLIVKFQGCYHGWHDAVAANVISPPERIGSIDPMSAGIAPHALDELAVLRFNDVAGFQRFMAERGDDVAAVIVEPVLHTIGCVVGTTPFLQSLRDETTRHGTVLIFDEVVTGFRHHLGGYQALCGVTPDLTTLAKSIANGYPLAAIVGARNLMEQFAPGGGGVLFGGTFNGHPVMTAAGLATVEILERDGGAVHRHLSALGERMKEGLERITASTGLPARVQQFRSVFACYFTAEPVRSFDDALTNDAARYVRFHREMIDRGFFMIPLNLKRNHLSAAHTVADVDDALTAADRVLSAMA